MNARQRRKQKRIDAWLDREAEAFSAWRKSMDELHRAEVKRLADAFYRAATKEHQGETK
jgi:NAD-specific glutamate dehydrogenase